MGLGVGVRCDIAVSRLWLGILKVGLIMNYR